jgi:hypothetical protein
MKLFTLLLLTSCNGPSAWGLEVFDLELDAIRAGANAAIAEDERAKVIVDRLDAFGHDLVDMPSLCRRIDLRIVEGCALTPGSGLARARILVAVDRDDEIATVKHEILNLVKWDEGYDPIEQSGAQP